jgi:hypothetical protein
MSACESRVLEFAYGAPGKATRRNRFLESGRPLTLPARRAEITFQIWELVGVHCCSWNRARALAVRHRNLHILKHVGLGIRSL